MRRLITAALLVLTAAAPVAAEALAAVLMTGAETVGTAWIWHPWR